MDMIGRDEDIPAGDPRFPGLTPTRASDNTDSVHLLGYTRSPGLAAIAREENSRIGLRLRTSLDDNSQNLVRRSDQWPFLRRGVPALFFFTGLHPDYHTPQDDVEKINFPKMEKIVRLAYRVAWRVANTTAVPAYSAPATDK
jgi:Zn-dependent M28 family amino/carboxypeptidase